MNMTETFNIDTDILSLQHQIVTTSRHHFAVKQLSAQHKQTTGVDRHLHGIGAAMVT